MNLFKIFVFMGSLSQTQSPPNASPNSKIKTVEWKTEFAWCFQRRQEGKKTHFLFTLKKVPSIDYNNYWIFSKVMIIETVH